MSKLLVEQCTDPPVQPRHAQGRERTDQPIYVPFLGGFSLETQMYSVWEYRHHFFIAASSRRSPPRLEAQRFVFLASPSGTFSDSVIFLLRWKILHFGPQLAPKTPRALTHESREVGTSIRVFRTTVALFAAPSLMQGQHRTAVVQHSHGPSSD